MSRVACTLLAIATLASVADAQSLESRIAAARGSAGFEYATRPNVCGDGYRINVSDDVSPGWTSRSRRSGVHVGTRHGGYERCEAGPARVLLRRSNGAVTSLQVTVGGEQAAAETEFGEVPPADAASYLLGVAPRLTGQSGDHAVMGAEIADDVEVWPRLLQIARDSAATESSRKAAVFWVSQEASAAAAAGLDSIATDDDATLSIRSDALFFLAQRPDGEGIPALVRVAETSKSVKLRKDAIFFLAQTQDPRALALFERLLGGH